MYHARSGSNIAVRLEAGELVHESLLAICRSEGVGGGFVISGIGMLKDPLLGWYDIPGRCYHEQAFPGCHELLTLSGNISLKDGEPFAHLHATMSHTDYHCFGGHLFSAEVGLTCELMLAVCDGPRMERRLEDEFGLPGLVITAG
jgi:uncharacterized protein